MPMLENRVGPYRIVRLIKGGGQGRVYLGYDSRLRRQVAIKIHDLPASRASRRQALAEARRASRISCPQVVQIYDIIESAGHLAIVMEYVPGCDLEQLLQHRSLSVASVLTIGLDLAAALAVARQQKVVHGDLKAANVLITRKGRAKLTDFGIARDVAANAIPQSGSESALTPEHLTGAGLDLRSDLFALGCLLYRMLYSEHPFIRDGALDTRLLISGEGPPPQGEVTASRERLPEGLASLVDHLLQRNPEARPANTHPVRRQLRLLRQQLPLSEAERLQLEAEPVFRAESPEDLPPDIPAGLREGGRSRLKRGLVGRTLRYLRGLRPSTRFTLAATLASAIGIPIALAMQEYPTRVHFDPPGLKLHSSDLPREVDEVWLMEQVYQAAEVAIGPLHASGSVRPRAYYALLADTPPEIVLRTSLRCDEALCLFSISRGAGESYAYQQVVISPQLPEPVWRELIAGSTRSLLD